MNDDSTSTARKVQSENGKTYYYLNIQQPSSAPEYDQKLQKLMELAEPIKGTLQFSEDAETGAGESSEVPFKYGDHMIMRNAREMFENVDILTDGRYFCRVCNRTYKTHATLTAHLRGSHLRQETACLERGCDHVSHTDNERRKHQKIHDKKRAKEFLQMQQKFDETPRLPIPCEDVLREQILLNNKDIPGMKKTITNSGRGKVKYSCEKCDQTFSNSYHASRHSEVHKQSPRRCFYCGEVRKGIMDLRVHYMRTHKNEGVRTFTCLGCQSGFTSLHLFQNHVRSADSQMDCRTLGVRQDVYYGELPAGVTIDQPTLNRLNFFRKRNVEREAREPQMAAETTVKMAGAPVVSAVELDIFGSNSMIQTEFGLVRLSDYKNSPQFRARSAVKRMAEEDEERDQDHAAAAKNACFEHQQHQPNASMAEYMQPQPVYGYDPLIGRYPDFQPMQNAQYASYQNYETYQSMPEYSNDGDGVPRTPELAPGQDALATASEMANELFGDGNTDAVFEELDKLDFAMPAGNENECDDDLTDVFDFDCIPRLQ